MLGWWTIGRASGVGATAALVALILWPFYSGAGDKVEWPFAAAASVAGLCGVSILLITAGDMLFHRRRGERIRPVRTFDILLAVALIALSLLQLDQLIGQLPAS